MCFAQDDRQLLHVTEERVAEEVKHLPVSERYEVEPTGGGSVEVRSVTLG